MSRLKNYPEMVGKFYILMLAILLTGCTTSRSIFDRRLGDENPSKTTATQATEVDSESSEDPVSESNLSLYEEFELALRSELEPWHGAPHVLGGTALNGVDCSGLIVRVFGDLLQLQTGRTTEQLMQEGKGVHATQLLAGDLVFFSPTATKKGGHVGIYLSKGEFTHVSSSQGVMTSLMTDPYWSRFFETSRRIIPNEEWLKSSVKRIRERQKLSKTLQSE